MIEKLSYNEIKQFCIDFCNFFGFNDVPIENLKVGITRKNGLWVMIKGVKTRDNLMLFQLFDDKIQIETKCFYKKQNDKQLIPFKEYTNQINQFYNNYILQKTNHHQNLTTL